MFKLEVSFSIILSSQLVCSYLEAHSSIVPKELLVMFYLKHSQCTSALELHEKLKASVRVRRGVGRKERGH